MKNVQVTIDVRLGTIDLRGLLLGKENVAGIMIGQMARIGVQAAYFVVLARLLGVSGYGAFAAVVAAGAIAAPFSSLGTNILMVRNVAQEPDTAKSEWSRALLYSTLLGALFAVAATVLVRIIGVADVGFMTIFWLVASDVVGLKIIETSGTIWQALGKSRQLVWLPPILYVVRLVIASSLLLSQVHVDLPLWAALYAASTIPLALCVAVFTTRKIPGEVRIRGFYKLDRQEIRDGLLFSVGISAATAYNDLDKTQLATIDSTATAGIYASAYKIIDMAYVPVRAIAIAVYPKFFGAGRQGIQATNRLAKRLLLPCFAMGFIGFLSVQSLAHLIPIMLGDGFEGTESIMRGLSFLLLIRPFSFTAGDSLTGAGNQGFRTTIQIVMAIASFIANLITIPTIGVWGAIVSTILCEICLALTLWSRAITLEKKHRRLGDINAYSDTP